MAVMPPLPNCSVASPLTRTVPVEVDAAAPDRTRLAFFVVPLVALPCKINVPLLASVVAFTVVDALRRDVADVERAVVGQQAPPKVAALPPSPLP